MCFRQMKTSILRTRLTTQIDRCLVPVQVPHKRLWCLIRIDKPQGELICRQKARSCRDSKCTAWCCALPISERADYECLCRLSIMAGQVQKSHSNCGVHKPIMSITTSVPFKQEGILCRTKMGFRDVTWIRRCR